MRHAMVEQGWHEVSEDTRDSAAVVFTGQHPVTVATGKQIYSYIEGVSGLRDGRLAKTLSTSAVLPVPAESFFPRTFNLKH
jgi:hypothetical protein